MITETTLSTEYSTPSACLYLAFELSNTQWKLGFTVGFGQKPRLRCMDAGDLSTLQREISLAKKRFGLPQDSLVRSCYEAGRDGFWLHRYLQSIKVENLIVDSASIEVNRRAKRNKTDRIDAGKLLTMLMRYHLGEQRLWSVLRVPSVAAEDGRQLHRELVCLKAERTRLNNRIKGLLTNQGLRLAVKPGFLDQLPSVRLWDGTPLPTRLQARLQREFERWLVVQAQIHTLEAERRGDIRQADSPEVQQVRHLLQLKGIGLNGAWLLVMEFFAWRSFHNRRQVAALAGLTPTPFQSGEEDHEQGISKAGNRFVRTMTVELAWCWLRYQPDSALSGWYQQRFGNGSKRLRKIGIVALARKLLVALWRYLETGVIPEGAVLKTQLI